MGVAMIRGVIAFVGVMMMLGGIAVAATGVSADAFFGALWLFVPGAVIVAGVLLERTRYRSLAAEGSGDAPGPGGGEVRDRGIEPRFRRTEEAFIDPSTGVAMRVYVDPSTGERRYVAEG